MGIFNATIAGNRNLSQIFISKNYDVLQSFQGLISSEIEAFVKKGLFKKPVRTIGQMSNTFFSILFLSVVSSISYFFLLVMRRKILIYSVDRVSLLPEGIDERLKPLYRVLHKCGVAYIEIFHTSTLGDFLKNFLKRRRPALYLEVLEPVISIIHLLVFSGKSNFSVDSVVLPEELSSEEKRFIYFLIDKYVKEALRFPIKIRLLTALFSLSNVKIFFSIDDPRYYNSLIVACRRNGIVSYAIQHGHFTKYHVGWLKTSPLKAEKISPDIFFVWNEYWKKELLRLGTYFREDSIVIGAPLSYGNINPKIFSDKNKIGILIPRENRPPYKEVREYIEAFLKCPAISVFFKVRPGIPVNIQLKEYGLGEDHPSSLQVVTDLAKAMPFIDMVVGTYSTLLYDMVASEVPVAILNTSSDYGEGMVKNGLAEKISLTPSLCQDVLRIAKTPKNILKERKDRLLGEPEKSIDSLLYESLHKGNII